MVILVVQFYFQFLKFVEKGKVLKGYKYVYVEVKKFMNFFLIFFFQMIDENYIIIFLEEKIIGFKRE